MFKILKSVTILLMVALINFSCNSTRHPGLFSKKTAREKYEEKLEKDSGKNNPYVNAWLNAAEFSLTHPLTIPDAYSEQGKFFPSNNTATSFRVFINRGEKLLVRLNRTSSPTFSVYMDLWYAPEQNSGSRPVYIKTGDTLTNSLEYIASKDENLILRYQAQLSAEGNYSITIKTAPSLVFPISASVKSYIGSLWGANRENGMRKHEGIDIFAAAKSPVVAVADGYITNVSENTLGGRVIFMHPDNSSYNVYYAHLDKQLVSEGQYVKAGEIIGLTGNTGNARFTASHLHFGIYSNQGAIDPLVFVERKKDVKQKLAGVELNGLMITKKQTKAFIDLLNPHQSIAVLDKNVKLQTEAFNGKYYRIILPDGRKAFADAKNLQKLKTPGSDLKIGKNYLSS